MYLFFSSKIVLSLYSSYQSNIAEVTNHWTSDWYQDVSYLSPGHTERINNSFLQNRFQKFWYFCCISLQKHLHDVPYT